MRRLLSIAAFALVLAVPLWAQRGGGHGGGGHGGGFGGGHGGGFSGGHGGGFGGGHGFGGVHPGGGRVGGFHGSPGFSRGFNHGPRSGVHSPGFSNHGPFRTGFGFRHRHFRDHDFDDRFRFRTWGVPFGSPWWYSGFYDPYWWWDDHSRFDDEYNNDRQIAMQMDQQSLEQQRMWRQEEADGDQDAYAPPRRSLPPRAQEDTTPDPPATPTVLVFRDQHKQEVNNYAIVGQTLWNFAPQKTQKIPLADLDIQATVRVNDDHGVSFHIPSSPEGQ